MTAKFPYYILFEKQGKIFSHNQYLTSQTNSLIETKQTLWVPGIEINYSPPTQDRKAFWAPNPILQLQEEMAKVAKEGFIYKDGILNIHFIAPYRIKEIYFDESEINDYLEILIPQIMEAQK